MKMSGFSKPIFILTLILAFMSAELVSARGGGSRGGGRSGGGSKSWGGGSSGKTWGGGNKSGGDSAKKAASTRPAESKADRTARDTSHMVGGKYTSRAAAVEAFRREQGDKYKNNFQTEPTSRPDYIPNTTTLDGKPVNLTYNPQTHGYGYMNPRGGWFSYNPMMDFMMLSMLMNSHGNQYVYHETAPQGQSNDAAAAHDSDSHGGFIIILILIVFIVGIVWWMRSSRRAKGTKKRDEDMLSDESNVEKGGISFWRNVKPGDILNLKDEITVDEQIKAGKGIDGLYIPVVRTVGIKYSGGATEWIFLQLKDIEPKTYVMVKSAGEFLDVRLYREAPDFTPGNRKEIIDAENYWVFEKPDNPDDYGWLELKYTDTVTRTIQGVEISYTLKSQGELDGECVMNPEIPGSEKLLATLAEYGLDTGAAPVDATTTDAGGRTPVDAGGRDYNELMFLEIGSPDMDEGGLIQLLEGRTLQLTDVEILSKQK